MLLFSEYLRELMQTKEMNISVLSRLIGIERTLLSKTLTGQRVLPYHALDDLIYHLRLTPGEEKQLRSYYDTQFEKEGIRCSREMIGKMFSDMACLDLSAPAFEETRLLMNLEQYAGSKLIFSGEMNVQFLLRIVISEEIERTDSCLELTVPLIDTFWSTELLQRFLNQKISMEIHHIVCFDASGAAEDINLHNLECFCHILPISLLSRQQYHPYYYYANSIISRYANPFPYFIVAHNCVVLLSEDGTCAMLLRDPEQIAYYQNYFRQLKTQCHSLLKYTNDPMEIINSYQNCTEPDGFYMVMDQPCFGRFYTEEFVQSHVRREIPGYELILQATQERFSLLRSVDNFYSIFSLPGLKRFMENGTLDDYPVELVTPFSMEERCDLMLHMAAAIKDGELYGRIFRESCFPNYLALCTTQEHGIGLFTTRQFPMADNLCSVWIREANLCRAFHGWLTHLPGSNQTMTVQETAAVLEELAHKKE